MYSLTANNELYSGMIKTSPLRKKGRKRKGKRCASRSVKGFLDTDYCTIIG